MSAITASAIGESLNEYDEKWRAINGYSGLYEISNFGRVRSLSKTVKACKGEKIIDGKLLKQSLKGNYFTIGLSSSRKVKHYLIHRLVAKAFVIGTGEVVRHLDGNSKNNNFNNLAWGSYKDNEADKRSHGTDIRGERHPNSILNDDLVRKIRKLHDEGHSQLKIASFLSINRGTIGHVVRGNHWKHVV